MRTEAVTANRSYVGPDQCLTGVSAALAEARQIFLMKAPQMSWADVTMRAAEVRSNQPMTLLQALNVVFERIADGQ
jgi:hypothetical protein